MSKCKQTLLGVFRSDLMRFVRELRSSSGGSLSSMTLQDVVGGVTQLILDHQVRKPSPSAAQQDATSTVIRQNVPFFQQLFLKGFD